MTNKVILVTTTSFPSFSKKQTGKCGGGQFLLTECKALQSAGFRVKVLAPQIKCAPKNENIDGIEVYRFKYPLINYNSNYHSEALYTGKGLLSFLSLVMMSLSMGFMVNRLNKQLKPQLIWANWLQVGVITKLAVNLRTKVLCTIRGSDIRGKASWKIHLMSKIMPDIFNIFPIDQEIQGWIKTYKFNAIAAPSVYDYRQINREHVKKEILVIGRLDKEDKGMVIKGLHNKMFTSLLKLCEQRNDFTITVVGDGINKEQYEAYFTPYTERVNFTGWKNNFNKYLETAYISIGGAALNGTVLDTVPYGIVPMISNLSCYQFWTNSNALIFNPLSSKNIINVINYALDNPKHISKISENAKNSINLYALPSNKAAIKWKEQVLTFIGNY